MVGQESLNFQSFIAALPADTRALLYQSAWTCQAIFRALGPVAQQYILRLLYIDAPVLEAYVHDWVKKDGSSSNRQDPALRALRSLSILQPCSDARGRSAYILQPDFQQCLRQALAGGMQQTRGVDQHVLRELPSMEEIRAFATTQWEGVLRYLLEPNKTPPSLPVGLKEEPLDIHNLLVTAGLISDGRYRALTAEGYRFLLLETHTQMWVLLREYIRTAEAASGGELASALSFLMQLGFRQVGRPYPLEALTPLEQRIGCHMAQLGLLFTFVAHDKAVYFCPTPLAASLCGGYVAGAQAGTSQGTGGYIIVETNFRVYAYTSSHIQVKVLQELCRMDCCLPNLFVGTLTREGFLAALDKGISASDAISFLQQHAHPKVANKVPSVPENVMDQLRLWEAETMRVVPYEAYIYESFETEELYEQSLSFAKQMGVLLWEPGPGDTATRAYCVSKQGHAQVREHIKTLKLEQMNRGI